MHHLRIVLKHVAPKVVREFLVPSDVRLDRLHDVIQIVMGWTDSHMHEFVVGGLREGLRYGPAGYELGIFGDAPADERKATLQQIAGAKGAKFLYSYDFGDDWLHEVAVKAIIEPIEATTAPVCLKATGACPPEDCGGPWGYTGLLEVLRDPKHEDHGGMREWVGEEWNPEFYDINEVNAALAGLARRWKRTTKKTRTTRA